MGYAFPVVPAAQAGESGGAVMTNDEFDARITRMDERLQALAESQELLQHTVLEAGSILRGLLLDTKERRERDQQYFHFMAQLLESWGGNGDGK